MGYKRNTWTVYDETIPDIQQPNSFITKAKLDHIERGIETAVTDLLMGTVEEGLTPKVEIVTDPEDITIKRLNMVIPKKVSWIFSEKELHDNETSPVGSVPGDMILDTKGNVFSVILVETGEYRLDYMINIKGTPGLQGPAGPQGLPGVDGQNGTNGKDGNKWIYAYKNVVEGEGAPEGSIQGDFVLDSEGDIFEVQEDLTCKKLLNIKGADGEDATNDYHLEIGEVTIGDTASAEIVNGNILNLTIPRGLTGATGSPGADGKDGAQGPEGDPGPAGKDGINGVGVENITSSLNEDGKTIEFTFIMTDGSSKVTAVTLP